MRINFLSNPNYCTEVYGAKWIKTTAKERLVKPHKKHSSDGIKGRSGSKLYRKMLRAEIKREARENSLLNNAGKASKPDGRI